MMSEPQQLFRRLGAFVAGGALVAMSAALVLAQTDLTSKPRSEAPLPTPNASQRAQMFGPGAAWDGRGDGNLTESEGRALSEFSVFWFGPAFQGSNLQGIRRVQYDPPPGSPYPGATVVTMDYGICTDRPCAVPITLVSQDICTLGPERLAPAITAKDRYTIGAGAEVQPIDEDSVLVWTGTSAVTIHLSGAPDDMNAAFAALRRMSSSQAEALPAPDWKGCVR